MYRIMQDQRGKMGYRQELLQSQNELNAFRTVKLRLSRSLRHLDAKVQLIRAK